MTDEQRRRRAEHCRRIGAIGGKTTAEKHGKEHMAKIGRAGFRRLCTRFPANSRRKALAFLHNKGTAGITPTCPAKLQPHTPAEVARMDRDYRELAAEYGLGPDPEF